MKIGILTFISKGSYGAVFQAYALGKHLEQDGHSVELIDYRPAYLERDFRPIPFPHLHGLSLWAKILRLGKWLALLPWSIAMAPCRLARRAAFMKFSRRHLRLSERRFFPGQSLEHYDAVIAGSDQIWNPEITDGGDCVFYGNPPTGATCRMIAYAASAGAHYSKVAQDRALLDGLHGFAAVSTRESPLATKLKGSLVAPIATVLDPTLLVAPSLWNNLAEFPPTSCHPYILLYEVEDAPWGKRVASELGQQKSARVVSIWAGYGSTSPWQSRMRVSPEAFLGWISKATCIVTSSFHGVALALSLAKPFYYVSRSSTPDVRIREILGNLGLEDRFMPAKQLPVFAEIDYSQGGTAAISLRLLRQRSSDFIRDSLKQITPR